MAESGEQFRALIRAFEALERSGLSYAVTGSLAASAYGLIRATHDLDVVIALRPGDETALLKAFSEPFLPDPLWVAEAASRNAFFNIIDGDSLLKVDFWPLKDETYSRQQFSRRRREVVLSQPVWVLALEDVILSKLAWHQMSESELQWRDLQALWEINHTEIDRNYLEEWAAQLGLTGLLARLKESV
ncbi:MAG: hypothetical protein HY784_03475 [Chloroflexi bacterium]|nr:hypothetical protein [Chloroflexota bacterium]